MICDRFLLCILGIWTHFPCWLESIICFATWADSTQIQERPLAVSLLLNMSGRKHSGPKANGRKRTKRRLLSFVREQGICSTEPCSWEEGYGLRFDLDICFILRDLKRFYTCFQYVVGLCRYDFTIVSCIEGKPYYLKRLGIREQGERIGRCGNLAIYIYICLSL